ncbi:Uncharacterized protein Adt_08919 [Abeliophyllum distichum]|uniref:SWIM-type domain-containing protein n=1 Tax=Abeliophyllum distichum TaxID=126358 RepID=A0ABD1UH30_9LAMI
MNHVPLVDETLLGTIEHGPQAETEEDDPEVLGVKFTDFEDDVNDDEFVYDCNVEERIAVGLNSDPVVEEQHADAIGEDSDSDHSYDPMAEELNTDYSSDEESNLRYPMFNEEKELWDPQFEMGKTFIDIPHFKKAKRNHGVAIGCNLRMKKNDDKRAQAVCKVGCKWRIWASVNKKLNCIQIKSYNPNHNCIRDGSTRHCTAKYIAKRYLDTFRVDPGWKPTAIRHRVLQDLRINIGRQTAWRARRFARILIEGSDEHQFGLLWSYVAELMGTNPGSTCRIAVHEEKFQGIYVCLDACKKGFLSGCRQLIGVDGCFLKGTFGGQMLVAVTLDANDCIYPLAFAIVQIENTFSWRWFMRNLGAEHRLRVRHMYTNFFRAEFKGLALKEILWKAEKSTTVADFKFWMSEMDKQNKPAYEWLLKRDPKEWSKSHFLTNVKSDILLNNMCECFNKILLEDREKSIVTMLIDMHISCMKRIQTQRDKMKMVVGPLCPKIYVKLATNVDVAAGSIVDWSGGAQWYIQSRDGEYVVDLESRTCTCKKWDLTGIPCAHGCAAIQEKRDQPIHYDWFGPAAVSQNGSQTSASTAKGKLQPRRSQQSAAASTSKPAPSEFHFMPTPGIIPANSDLYTTEGPAPTMQPAGMENVVTSELMTEVQTQSFFVDNMVDDLNQIREEEQVCQNKRLKNRRGIRR